MKAETLEYEFAMKLHEELRKKIYGGIYVEVRPIMDELYVVITNDIYPRGFRIKEGDFSRKLLYGLSAEEEACEIMRIFKNVVMKRLFK